MKEYKDEVLTEILNKDARELLEESVPWQGAETDMPDLFGKYGYGLYGICDGFKWKNELENASELEIWKMIALSNMYWFRKYKKFLELAEIKSSKLDGFIGHCEREYFGYDKDGYTYKTIEKILNKVIEILDKHLKK
jgi:hypothetical protein